ncbi:MAG: response regulator [Candidatus Omnitrophota bacterium]|nr:response regulator [Candidatus Omnitrophota bacterium]
MPKLLIVDDEQDIREFAQNFFRRRGIDVLTAANGREALTIFEQENPDLILMDIRMDEINGLDVLAKIRQKNKDVKVIMVSGVEEKESMERAKSLGAIGYIHKPLVLEELEKIVLKEIKHE